MTNDCGLWSKDEELQEETLVVRVARLRCKFFPPALVTNDELSGATRRAERRGVAPGPPAWTGNPTPRPQCTSRGHPSLPWRSPPRSANPSAAESGGSPSLSPSHPSLAS